MRFTLLFAMIALSAVITVGSGERCELPVNSPLLKLNLPVGTCIDDDKCAVEDAIGGTYHVCSNLDQTCCLTPKIVPEPGERCELPVDSPLLKLNLTLGTCIHDDNCAIVDYIGGTYHVCSNIDQTCCLTPKI